MHGPLRPSDLPKALDMLRPGTMAALQGTAYSRLVKLRGQSCCALWPCKWLVKYGGMSLDAAWRNSMAAITRNRPISVLARQQTPWVGGFLYVVVFSQNKSLKSDHHKLRPIFGCRKFIDASKVCLS